MRTALVLSGATTKEQAAVFKPPTDWVCTGVGELIEKAGLIPPLP